MKNRLARLASSVATLLVLVACNAPIPSEPTKGFASPPFTPTIVTGTVYVHSASGVTPLAREVITLAIETRGVYRNEARVTTGDDGSYRFFPEADVALVRIKAMATGRYQPCGVTVTTLEAGTYQRDVHLVTDVSLLGANLPDVFTSQAQLVVGQVFETTALGRQPVDHANVSLDDLYGDELIVASTLTGSDGRFILCGASPKPGGGQFLWASKNGFELFGDFVSPSSADIELRRK